MGSRVFNTLVIGLWLLTTGWLLVTKFLPPLMVGEPPNYRTIISVDERKQQPLVCWSIRWSHPRRTGKAVKMASSVGQPATSFAIRTR